MWGHSLKGPACKTRREVSGETKPVSTVTLDSSLQNCEKKNTFLLFKPAVPQPFRHQGQVSWKTTFPQTGVGRWFGDDSSTLHLLWILFLSLLHHLHLRSSGIRSWRSGTPGSSHHSVVFVMAALANEYIEKERTGFRVWPIPRICLN